MVGLLPKNDEVIDVADADDAALRVVHHSVEIPKDDVAHKRRERTPLRHTVGASGK
jgi:hypothetical protein